MAMLALFPMCGLYVINVEGLSRLLLLRAGTTTWGSASTRAGLHQGQNMSYLVKGWCSG